VDAIGFLLPEDQPGAYPFVDRGVNFDTARKTQREEFLIPCKDKRHGRIALDRRRTSPALRRKALADEE
jgi:hypothetical protein